MSRRVAAGIEYDGAAFLGWQKQRHGPSVQEEVESALSFVADRPVEVICAGRTDTGVHAQMQVVHFDTEVLRAERSWVLGANAKLPESVRIHWAREVDDQFHARYSAVARCYRYTLLNREVRPAIGRHFQAWERAPLDAEAMCQAAQFLIGKHDFSAFRTVACQARSPIRSMFAIKIWREHQHVYFELCANAFLHHMVRNIVGSLLMIGKQEKPIEWMKQVLESKKRELAGPTAPAQGLVFIGPAYPSWFELPAVDNNALMQVLDQLPVN